MGLCLINRQKALQALVPDLFDSEIFEEPFSRMLSKSLSTIQGQWFPPGISFELSPQKTDQLINALTSINELSVEVTLASCGLSAVLTAPLASSLMRSVENVVLSRLLSSTGAVGLKIVMLVPSHPMVTPYPA